jgi:hypothetical protein
MSVKREIQNREFRIQSACLHSEFLILNSECQA